MTLPKWAQEIRTRLEAATPGPWVNRPRGVVQSQSVKRIIFWDDEPNQGDTTEDIQPSYALIAHAPTDLARLLGALETCVTVLAKIDAQTNWCTDKTCIRSGCAAEAQIWARQALAEIEGDGK